MYTFQAIPIIRHKKYCRSTDWPYVLQVLYNAHIFISQDNSKPKSMKEKRNSITTTERNPFTRNGKNGKSPIKYNPKYA